MTADFERFVSAVEYLRKLRSGCLFFIRQVPAQTYDEAKTYEKLHGAGLTECHLWHPKMRNIAEGTGNSVDESFEDAKFNACLELARIK